jgi:hypothetical protein
VAFLLGLKLALDGGHVACQGIPLSGFERRICGRGEIQADGTVVRRMLTRVHATAALPIVRAAFPK